LAEMRESLRMERGTAHGPRIRCRFQTRSLLRRAYGMPKKSTRASRLAPGKRQQAAAVQGQGYRRFFPPPVFLRRTGLPGESSSRAV
jgi:hypothetical protein